MASIDPFTQPSAGQPTPVRFPLISRTRLDNGVRVWVIEQHAAPVVNVAMIFPSGTGADPSDAPGLAGLTADLLDEGAGGRTAIELAEMMSRLGSHLDVGIGPDMLSMGFAAMTRAFGPALDVLGTVVRQPHLAEVDFTRIRELRINRLRQLRQSGTAVAERVFLEALFGSQGYGHGAIGTTRSLEAMTLDAVRGWHAMAIRPEQATLIVAGDITASEAARAAHHALAGWPAPASRVAASSGAIVPPMPAAPRVLLVDRPAAPQSELRIGHTGPPRAVDAYHALVTINATLGGQFSSRINAHLRELKGWTYGARTLLDFRRDSGTFACETSVQADATAPAIADVLEEFRAIRGPRAASADELDRAKRLLTRGYVRLFETAGHLTHAAAQLAAFHLPDDTFDRFVPSITAVDETAAVEAARRFIQPEACVAVVVGDAQSSLPKLEALGYPVTTLVPDF